VSRRRLVLVALAPVGIALGLALTVLVEAQLVRSREFAPDPDFDIDRTVGADQPGALLELAVFGDSTVAGLGVDDVAETLPVQVAQHMADELGRPVRVRGFGVSGAVTADVVREQLPQLDGQVDVVAFEIGSNDVTHLTKLDDLRRDTRRMLDVAAAHAPVVVLGGSGRLDGDVFPRPLRDLTAWRARSVRAAQGDVAGAIDGVSYVDVGGDEVGDEYVNTPGADSSDEFHPSAIGYGIWARAIADAAIHALRR